MNLQDIYECNHLITLALYQLEFSNFDLMIDIWYLILALAGGAYV